MPFLSPTNSVRALKRESITSDELACPKLTLHLSTLSRPLKVPGYVRGGGGSRQALWRQYPTYMCADCRGQPLTGQMSFLSPNPPNRQCESTEGRSTTLLHHEHSVHCSVTRYQKPGDKKLQRVNSYTSRAFNFGAVTGIISFNCLKITNLFKLSVANCSEWIQDSLKFPIILSPI